MDSIKIYWNLDKDYYEQELKIKNPEKNRGFIKTANFGSHSLAIGAQVSGVGEPHLGIQPASESNLLRSEALIQVEFDAIAEPKALRPSDLLRMVEVYGSYLKAAAAIGASEAFIRQNCKKSLPAKPHRHQRR